MWQSLTPPNPPADAVQFLSELAAYYQELVEYHQQAVQQAIVSLSHLIALLDEKQTIPGEIVPVSEPNSIEQFKLEQGDQSTNQEVQNKPNQITTVKTTTEENSSNKIEKVSKTQGENNRLRKSLLDLFRVNRGKILQIDYIFRELTKEYQNLEVEEVKIMLVKEEVGNLWASVPDSPGCWTIDLKNIADLPPKDSIKKSQPPAKKSKIDKDKDKSKLTNYPSFRSAVIDCVKKSYPQVCTTLSIFQWLYPTESSFLRQNKTQSSHR